MNNILFTLINAMPLSWKKHLINPKTFFLRRTLKNKILAYYSDTKDPEIKEIISFIKKNKLTAFCYDFIFKYEMQQSDISYDKKAELFYISIDNKRLYFKRSLNNKMKVQSYYNAMCKEQDAMSPHRYININHNISGDGCIIDAGTAEGNFAFQVIDKAKKIYLFECDPEWIEALQHTFANYKDKISIIQKYIGGTTNAEMTTIDDFCASIPEYVDFIKMDIEGMEIEALRASQKTLKNNPNCRLSVCAYHHQNDEQEIRSLIKDRPIQAANGYILNYFDKKIAPPFFRRGVLWIGEAKKES